MVSAAMAPRRHWMRASSALGLVIAALLVGAAVLYLGSPAYRGHLSALAMSAERGASPTGDRLYTSEDAKAIVTHANSLRGRPAWCVDTFLWTYQSEVRRACEGRQLAAHIGTKCDVKARGSLNTAILDLALRACTADAS
jgi:hypothetical protein